MNLSLGKPDSEIILRWAKEILSDLAKTLRGVPDLQRYIPPVNFLKNKFEFIIDHSNTKL